MVLPMTRFGAANREVDLAQCLGGRLAHLTNDQRGELLAALHVQLADPGHDGGPLGHGGVERPLAVGGIRRREHGLQLVVGVQRVRA